jgi:hypothetical protein
VIQELLKRSDATMDAQGESVASSVLPQVPPPPPKPECPSLHKLSRLPLPHLQPSLEPPPAAASASEAAPGQFEVDAEAAELERALDRTLVEQGACCCPMAKPNCNPASSRRVARRTAEYLPMMGVSSSRRPTYDGMNSPLRSVSGSGCPTTRSSSSVFPCATSIDLKWRQSGSRRGTRSATTASALAA